MSALAVSFVLSVSLLSNPAFEPPVATSSDDAGGCLVGPLQLTLSDLGRMGDLSRQVGKRSCFNRGLPGDLYGYERPMTVARTEEGGRILIPNRRLLRGVTAVDRRQSGVRLALRFRAFDYPEETVLSNIKNVLVLSPYRAAGSQVTAEYDAARGEIAASLRIPRATAQDAARREISLKIAPLIASAKPSVEQD